MPMKPNKHTEARYKKTIKYNLLFIPFQGIGAKHQTDHVFKNI